MKNTNIKRKDIYTALILLFFTVMLTVPSSLAKHVFRREYSLKLAIAEHFIFSAGQSHVFAIPYDGYYVFQLWGADGGDSRNTWSGGQEIYELGGIGGKIIAGAYFEKDVVLTIVVGSKGDSNDGGYNGGGNGGADFAAVFNNYYGGGGGGATDVRYQDGTLMDRVLVAGGGGGGSGGSLKANGSGYAPVYGGNGGDIITGYLGENGLGGGYGFGGTQFVGGEGYVFGTLGAGGGGNYSGGGGGGGYYGGGGAYGSGGGGGGGSSHIAAQFEAKAIKGLPDRVFYTENTQDGYAIVSFLGDVVAID